MVQVRGRVPLMVVLLIGAVGVVLVSACSAWGARGHVFDKSFGEPCLVEPCAGGTLKEPDGVAVNEASGDVYVVDKGDNRVERFSASGTYLGQFDGSGTFEVEGKTETGVAAGGGGLAGESPTGKFSAPEAVAVDNSCGLHKPAPLTEASKPKTCIEVDPSNGDVYVLDTGHEVIDKFSATGEYIGQITETSGVPFLELLGIAVDSSGQLWTTEESNPDACASNERPLCINNYSNQVKNIFKASRRAVVNSLLEPGLAIDANDNLYIHVNKNTEGTDVISKFNSNGVELNGAPLKNAFDTQPPSGVALNPTQEDLYIDNFNMISRFSSDGLLIERLVVPGGHGSGISVNSGRETVYVADSVVSVVDVYSPEPPGRPTVVAGSGFVSRVISDEATLNAAINPRGTSTSYSFRLGRCKSRSMCATSGYESTVPTPEGSVGSDFDEHFISISVRGLQPAATYHFQVTSHNTLSGADIATGEEVIFNTRIVGGSFALLDNRNWELVSPPDKGGASLQALNAPGIIQASASGTAFSYLANAPTDANSQGNANGVQVFSKRDLSEWTSHDIAAPHLDATGASTSGSEYVFFSSDLSRGILQPLGAFVSSLSNEASERTAFVRTLYLDNNIDHPCVVECYHPDVTGKPGYSNVPVGTKFGQEDSCLIECGPRFRGATPDLSHQILESGVGLTDGTSGGLYEWNAGHLTFIGAGIFETKFHAVSDDGSRVVFSAGHEQLLMRDVDAGVTVQLDAAEPGCSLCGSGNGEFQGASSDGLRIFFTDQQHLTENAGSQSDAPDLYMCEIVVDANGPRCLLSDLTPLGANEEHASIVGHILGMSSDGTWLYFVANGRFEAGREPGTCVEQGGALGATCGLYVLHRDVEGWSTPKLIRILSQDDFPDWASDLEQHPARVSPNGRWLAFLSDRNLTGYDNRDLVSGKQDQEVYLFDGFSNLKSTDGQAGGLVCVSCDPSGVRPIGRVTSGSNSALFNGENIVPTGEGVAGTVPGWTAYVLGGVASPLYQSRYLSDTGRLFFNASGGLVPSDVNNNWDVYEFEPLDIGTCDVNSSSFSSGLSGCVDLISNGTSAEESVFLDASMEGGDVFFLTSSRLVSKDRDSGRDVYDAHECHQSEAPCAANSSVESPDCVTGDSCKAAPSAQPEVFILPASGTFNGIGNVVHPKKPAVPRSLTRAQKLSRSLQACRTKRNRRKRGICEVQSIKRYGSMKIRKKASPTRH